MIPLLFVQGAGERAGAERMLLAMLRRLDRSRFRPTVAVLEDGPFVAEIQATGTVTVLVPNPGRLREPWRARTTVQALRREIRRTGARVVQAHGEKVAVYAGLAARLERVPSLVRLHDAPAPAGAWSTIAVQTAMAVTPKTSVVTCSAWLADAFHRRYGIDAQPIRNGIELDRVPAPGSGRTALLRETGWPEDAIVFGHFGRLEAWKGVDVFLQAAGRVAAMAAADRCRFLVVGGALYRRDEDYATSLPGLAADLGIGPRTCFTGHRSDSLDLLSGCDVAVHAALKPEPLGNVVLEAMAAGAAVIASKSRGPEETVLDGVTGLLTRCGDADALADAMARMLDPGTRTELSRAARRDVELRWDVGRMVASFEDRWLALASQTPGSATAATGAARP